MQQAFFSLIARTASRIPATLRPITYISYHLHRDYDLHFEHPARQTPSTNMTYILVSLDRGPLTFSFPMFLTFGLSGRYLYFPLR
jgi:hypothetical protein